MARPVMSQSHQAPARADPPRGPDAPAVGPRCSPGYEWESYPLASMGRNVVWRGSLVLMTSIIERE